MKEPRALHRSNPILPSLALLLAAASGSTAAPGASAVKTITAPGTLGRSPTRLLTREEASQMPGWSQFLAEAGPGWSLWLDDRTGRPALIEGGGLAWVAGNGNDPTNVEPAPGPERLVQLEKLARAVLDRHPQLFRVPPAALQLNRTATVLSPEGTGSVVLDYVPSGVPVLSARILFRVNHGKVVQIGSLYLSEVDLDPVPVVSEPAALEAARRAVGPRGGDFAATPVEPSLVFVPLTRGAADQPYLGTPGAGYVHRLVRRLRLERLPAEAWDVWVDAHSGDVVHLESGMHELDAYVYGGVRPVDVTDDLVSRGFSFATVTTAGGPATTNRGGGYAPSATGTVNLTGPYACLKDDYCTPALTDCGTAEVQAVSVPAPSPIAGDVQLGLLEGLDCAVPAWGAANTNASRTTVYHLNLARATAMGYYPAGSALGDWLRTAQVRAWINYSVDECTATGVGLDVAMRKGSANCRNTGEMPSVVYHEWGHVIDGADGGPPGTPEAYADVMAVNYTHDSCIARGLYLPTGSQTCPINWCGSCDGRRDLAVRNPTTTPPSPMTPWNVQDFCTQPIPCEGHCVSLVASGAFWDMAVSLASALGEQTGWAHAQRLWYLALPSVGAAWQQNPPLNSYSGCTTVTQSDGCNPDSWYKAFIALDDDNATFADGTPNGCLIWDAFNAHGIACGARPPCAPSCTSLPAPQNLRVNHERRTVRLEWDPVPFAEEYQVYRNEAGRQAAPPAKGGCDRGFVPYAVTTQPQFVDQEVFPSTPYSYMVEAMAGLYCRSAMSECLEIAPPPEPVAVNVCGPQVALCWGPSPDWAAGEPAAYQVARDDPPLSPVLIAPPGGYWLDSPPGCVVGGDVQWPYSVRGAMTTAPQVPWSAVSYPPAIAHVPGGGGCTACKQPPTCP